MTDSYTKAQHLHGNDYATAAAIDLIKAACTTSSASSNTVQALKWAVTDDNLKKLRDKIKESASKT